MSWQKNWKKNSMRALILLYSSTMTHSCWGLNCHIFQLRRTLSVGSQWTMANFRRLLFMAFVTRTIADSSSVDPIGVRFMLNRGMEDVATCTTDEQAIVIDILEVALSAQVRGKLRAPAASQSCIKRCQGNELTSCFYIDPSCYESSHVDVASLPNDYTRPEQAANQLDSRRIISHELQDLCRNKKRKVISVLKREVSSSELSGQCKAFVGGRVELACHLLAAR